jgi:hypothetical protein
MTVRDRPSVDEIWTEYNSGAVERHTMTTPGGGTHG